MKCHYFIPTPNNSSVICNDASDDRDDDNGDDSDDWCRWWWQSWLAIGDSDVKVLSSRREIVGCQMQARDSLQSDFSKRFFIPGLTFPILAHHLWGNFGIAHHLKTPLDWSFNRWCIQYTSGAKFVFKPKFRRSFSDLILYNLQSWIFRSDFEQPTILDVYLYIFSCFRAHLLLSTTEWRWNT